MYLRQLALTNFRNYARLGLNLEAGVTVFSGENAQGKSNLLEAVHVLATTRSLRATTDRELVSWQAAESGTPFARVEGRAVRADGELHLELLIRADPAEPDGNGNGPSFGKTVKVNGLPSRAAQLVGQVNVVLFSPEDVALAAGPPVGRRRYLDITNSQVSPTYLRDLQRYNRVLVQRNQLLRQIRERRQPRALLAPWDDEQVDLGTSVLAQRLKMVARINAVIGERFRQLSGTRQQLEITYTPTSLSSARLAEADMVASVEPGARTGSAGPGRGARQAVSVNGLVGTRQALADAFRARLSDVAGRELEQAVSLIGPHRDDFSFRLDGIDLGTYGSRGQQRLAVLALKLAEVEFMESETAERPILLLDDVLSELDPARRVLVLEQACSGGQTLITTTNLADLSAAFLERAAIYRIEAGTVVPEPGVASA